VTDAAAPTTTLTCASCGETAGEGALFCEACGAELAAGAATTEGAPPAANGSAGQPHGEDATMQTPAPRPTAAFDPLQISGPCPSCGSTQSTDGWCDVCGSRMPRWRDHFVEQPAPWVAGVCDRGISHARNEDAMALAADEPRGSFVALVVCDGVTSAPDSDIASLDASRAARDLIVERAQELKDGATTSRALQVQQLSAALVDAGEVANNAARAAAERLGWPTNPPSCTYAVAVAVGELICAGWAGDSRVYWLPDEGPAEQMSIDDSWATQQILAGVAREVAEAEPQAHAITRWLGADSADHTVSCSSTTTQGKAGWLLVCSDGLWNYVSLADDVRNLIAGFAKDVPPGSSPEPVASKLIDWANEQGGHDNITAALARYEPAIAAGPTSTPAPSSSTADTSTPSSPAPSSPAPNSPAPSSPVPDSPAAEGPSAGSSTPDSSTPDSSIPNSPAPAPN
jgi:serine/threonine protein phosphatase PrpC